MKVPQKRKLPRFIGGKMQREDSNSVYLLLLSLADCYSSGKPLPNASFLTGGVRDQRLMLSARYIVL